MKTVLMCGGVILICCCFFLSIRRIRVLLFGQATVGEVVRFETRESDDSVSYFPVIQYVNSNGEKNIFTSTSGVSPSQQVVGSLVHIRYLRSKKPIAYIDNFQHIWGGPLAFLFLGASAFYVGWFL